MIVDVTLYPELEPDEVPRQLTSRADRADYLQRLCAAWDFYGFPPDNLTVAALRGWGEVFQTDPLPHSPAFFALCQELGFSPPEPGRYLGEIKWEIQDRAEGRPLDLCADEV